MIDVLCVFWVKDRGMRFGGLFDEVFIRDFEIYFNLLIWELNWVFIV